MLVVVRFIRKGVKLSPLIHGGAQEREKRAGTENVAGIVGFGKAAELALQLRATDSEMLTGLREKFITLLETLVPQMHLNGSRSNRLPGNVNISIPGVEGATLLMALDRSGVCVSSGAACSSGSIEPSHVLKAIGAGDTDSTYGIRFSLGRGTTWEELEKTAQILSGLVERMQAK